MPTGGGNLINSVGSTPLPPTAVNQEGDLVGFTATQDGARLRIFNNTNAALLWSTQHLDDQVYTPSGWVDDLPLERGDTSVHWKCLALSTTLPQDNTVRVLYYNQTDVPKEGLYRGPLPGFSLAGSAGPLVFNVLTYGAIGNGMHDDTTAILNAIQAASEAGQLLAPGDRGGAIVYFPPQHTYLYSASLILTSDWLTFAGGGWSSVLKPASGAQFDAVSSPIPGASGTAGFTRIGCVVRDLTIDCSAMTGTAAGQGNALHFYGARRCIVEHVQVTGCPNWFVLWDGDGSSNFSYNNHVLRCFEDTTNGGIRDNFSEANFYEDNTLNSLGSATLAAQPSFGAQDTAVNVVRADSGYSTIARNVIGTNLGFGGSSTTSAAVKLTNSGPCRVIGNRFDQVFYQAMIVNGAAHIIESNQFGSPSKVGSVAAIDLGSSHNCIVGNQFETSAGAAHYTYCINETGANLGNMIHNNHFVAGTLGTILQNAASTNSIAGNDGYNPVGSGVPQPAVPASTVAQKNFSGVDCAVVIQTLGTLTAIAIGGVPLGGVPAAGSSYRVPSGQTITPTYGGAAPTWAWFGD
jgi:hypothetical protein